MPNVLRTLTAKPNLPWILSVAAAVLMTVSLHLQGRVWWCKLGDYSPWVSDAWSTHTSQHLLDPYAFTHVLHGMALFWILEFIAPKMQNSWRFLLAVVAEGAWEIVENSDWIINKYRENTASLDYFGDSALNSLGDLLACALGFWVAVRLGWLRSVVIFLLIEAILLIWIRDSLLLNILMLIYPIDAVKQWQVS